MMHPTRERRLTGLCLLVPMLAIGFTGAARAADMPFIEVNLGSLTAFRERGTGKPFVMVGVNYFDHEVGWAPKLWQKFDESRVRQHLQLIHDGGFNTIRVFLTLKSFHSEAGQVDAEGEAKFRTLLSICRELNIYVMPTGPDHWEGVPAWRKGDPYADDAILQAEDAWWKTFTARFKDEPAIIAWDLFNEPTVDWDTPSMKVKWNEWLKREYTNVEKIAATWARPMAEIGTLGEIAVPPKEPALNDARLYDYQRFREHIGDEWTRRHATAIRSADKNHMITVGHIQNDVPIFLPSVWHYAAFDMKQNARHVDFVSVHFYPILSPRPCDKPEGFSVNAAYLEALLYMSTTDKPLVFGEFGWYGGGELRVNGMWALPDQPVEHQAEWCRQFLTITRGRAAGWLNWAMADTESSTDMTRWSGVWNSALQLKPWGKIYTEFARQVATRPDLLRPFPAELTAFPFDRKAMLTSPDTGKQYLERLRQALSAPATVGNR